jgi:hypothetical protein
VQHKAQRSSFVAEPARRGWLMRGLGWLRRGLSREEVVYAPSPEPPFKPLVFPAVVFVLPADGDDHLWLMAKSAALAVNMPALQCFALSLPMKVLSSPLASKEAATCLSHDLTQCIRGALRRDSAECPPRWRS